MQVQMMFELCGITKESNESIMGKVKLSNSTQMFIKLSFFLRNLRTLRDLIQQIEDNISQKVLMIQAECTLEKHLTI